VFSAFERKARKLRQDLKAAEAEDAAALVAVAKVEGAKPVVADKAEVQVFNDQRQRLLDPETTATSSAIRLDVKRY